MASCIGFGGSIVSSVSFMEGLETSSRREASLISPGYTVKDFKYGPVFIFLMEYYLTITTAPQFKCCSGSIELVSYLFEEQIAAHKSWNRKIYSATFVLSKE